MPGTLANRLRGATPNAGRQTLRHYSLNDVQKIGNVDKCSWANK